jgi:hypothetical protein
MDFLVLSPPVTTPAEPPSGAFLLAAGLAGHGYDCGLLDLSLEFFWRTLEDPGLPGPDTAHAVRYLLEPGGPYDDLRHRGAAGALHARLRRFGQLRPGWRLTLMDLAPAGQRLHEPLGLAARLAAGDGPFGTLWQDVVGPTLERHRPARVLLSVAYLSQLAGALDLASWLTQRGIEPVVGGSLFNSMARTGEGLGSLAELFGQVELGDGASLLSPKPGHLLERLAWPQLLSERPYLSSRPIVPLTLSTGCFWNRCLFCPDRGMPFIQVPTTALDALLDGMPDEVAGAAPVVHLLDSALPPARLRDFLPLSAQRGLGFYGFARPTANLRARDLLVEAADAGCLMLQLGVEGGSGQLLDRFGKGLDPAEAARVLREAAGVGIRTYLYLLFGLPGETTADLEATLDLVADNADSVDFLNLSVFNLPRHSELTRRAAEFGIELEDFPGDDAIRLYRPFRCADGSPREASRDFLNARFRPDPRIKPAVRRTPRWLRAAHLALMEVPGRRS